MLRTSPNAIPCSQRVRPALAPLQSGDLTLLGDYADAIDAIRALITRPGLNEAALRSGIGRVIAERLPAPGGERIRPGSTPGEVAVMIADRLRSRPGPATWLFSELAGEPVMIEAAEPVEAPLSAGLAAELDAAPGIPGWHRDGQFIVPRPRPGITAALTELDLIPGRVPPGAMARIRGGEPCGPVLAEYGMRRCARDAGPTGGDPAVEASAKLRIGEVTIGRAGEKVPRAFCQRVAAATGKVVR